MRDLSLLELLERLPTEDAARVWLEAAVWGEKRCCGHCGSERTRDVPNARPMPYWCSDCRRYFTVPSARPCRRHSPTSASMCRPFSPLARSPR